MWISTAHIHEHLLRIEERLLPLEAIMSAMDDLKREVQETRGVVDSAIVFIQGLKKALDDAIASGDPSALTQLSQDLDASQTALSDAIAANSPPPAPQP